MSDWAKRNARALLREFQAHGLATGIHLVDYQGEDLRGQTFLADESLAGADFRGADLSDAQFLGGVDLVGADLSNCRLAGARLDRANLAGARLTGASLDGASLIGADLRGATIDATTWRQARLIGALLPDRVPSDTWGAALPSATPRLEIAGAGAIPALSWHPGAHCSRWRVVRASRSGMWPRPVCWPPCQATPTGCGRWRGRRMAPGWPAAATRRCGCGRPGHRSAHGAS